LRTEQFTIARRWFSSLPPITVEIACAADTPAGIRLGLAVKVAIGQKANLTGANLSRADLTGANLSRADLSGAYLSGANLSGANLTGANLTAANLSRADLTGANLTGADLSGAYLSGANLSGANLTGANLTGAKINGEPVTRCFARIMRDDGYGFLAFTLEAGGVKIMAGCRWFTVADFRAHGAARYPDTNKATETLWILDAIERRAVDLGIALTPEPVAKPKRARKAAA
jgi:uncharacterized protein YjbI with pentapeptide repeats